MSDWVVDYVEAARIVEAGGTVLDTRGAFDFFRGHVPGAVRVGWRIGTLSGLTEGKLDEPAVVAAAFATLGVRNDTPVLVVGNWDEGWGDEGRIAWDLAWLGHADVHVLKGGMATWRGGVDHLGSSPELGQFVVRLHPEIRADLRAAREAAVLMDVREPEEYGGARRYGEARGGHIPGAQSRPWRTLLQGDPELPKDARIVVYCTGGVRSGMAWLHLRDLGYTNVANYDGSWWDYARAPGAPVER